jgi:aminoglycoside/choline kinase family phosphotransferase
MTTLLSPAAELVQEALAFSTGGRAPETPLTVVSSQELSAATGRRRVVRHLVDGLDPSGPVPVIAKTFSEPHRAQLLRAHLAALSAGPFALGRFRVPRLLGFHPEANLVLLQSCAGVRVDELAPEDAVEGVRDAARWLAELHTSDVELPRRFDVARETASAHDWAAIVGEHVSDQRQDALRLASAWSTVTPPAPGSGVPIHKDFHAGHVLIDAAADHRFSTVAVIDLDEARLGDAAFDLAHFCAYLEFSGDDGGLRDAFLQEYTLRTGDAGAIDERALASYEAYTWLKIAKQLALRSGPCRAGGTAERWTVGDAVVRGLACLAP